VPTQKSLGFDNTTGSDSHEIIDILISLGVGHNIAKTLICLHKHGPSKSIDLQERCELRQPDVSIAISRLNELGVVNIVPMNSKGRGRPSHIYELAMPLEEALVPFRRQANERLIVIQNQLSRLAELASTHSN
jgi:predicted transcriptional regulator